MHKLISLLKTWLRISEVRRIDAIGYSEVDLVQEYIYYVLQQIKQGTITGSEMVMTWIHNHRDDKYEHANGFCFIKNYDGYRVTAELITGLSYLNWIVPTDEKYTDILDQLVSVRDDIMNKWITKLMSGHHDSVS